MSHERCEERSGHVKKRMRQLTTANSTLLFKYTCTVCTCMCHEEIHAQECLWSVEEKSSVVPRLSSSRAYIDP